MKGGHRAQTSNISPVAKCYGMTSLLKSEVRRKEKFAPRLLLLISNVTHLPVTLSKTLHSSVSLEEKR